ncbi:MAG: DMT family transporter, partial [Nitrospira sp.]|nr:DMT family transporter [Nitrospira sp.]
AAAGAALLIWGGTPIVTKIAIKHIDPLMVGMLRTLLAAAVTGPLTLTLNPLRPKTKSDFGLLTISALGGFVLFPLLFSLGLRFTTSSHGALILATTPIFTGIFVAVLDRRIPTLQWFYGVSLAFIGEFFLIAFRLGFDESGSSLIGDLLVLSACMTVAMGYTAGGKLSQTYGTWATTLWGITLAGLILIPIFGLRARSVNWTAMGLTGWLAIGYLAFLASVLAYLTWYWALAKGGIARISVSQFAQPIISLLLAVGILHERMTLPLVLAAATILLGIYLAQRR